MTAFQDALRTHSLAALREIPKSDLHNHAHAGGNRAWIAREMGRDIVPLVQPLQSMAEMHAWVSQQFGSVFAGPEGRLKAFEATLVQARLDGIVRLETGESPWAITLHDNSAAALTEAMRAVHARVAPDIAWVPQLELAREVAVDIQARRLAPLLELGFWRALDLSGDELAQPAGFFKPLYRMAKSAGLRLKAHAGEWGDADAVWRAVEELELDEVQHGIAAAQSEAVMRFLASNRIRLNICPTSNVMLGRASSLLTHPIRKLFDAGVIVTINTDDVLVFGQGVSEEFLSLFKAKLFNADELDRIRLAGLNDPMRQPPPTPLHRVQSNPPP